MAAKTEKITLTLPRDLMQKVREHAPQRGQSKFVADAVAYFIEAQEGLALREELVAGYKAVAAESAAMAEEGLPLGLEAWDSSLPPYEDEGTDDTLG